VMVTAAATGVGSLHCVAASLRLRGDCEWGVGRSLEQWDAPPSASAVCHVHGGTENLCVGSELLVARGRKGERQYGGVVESSDQRVPLSVCRAATILLRPWSWLVAPELPSWLVPRAGRGPSGAVRWIGSSCGPGADVHH